MTEYENLARDGTITDPTVILRWRDREFGYRPEGIDRWIWDRVELEGGLWPFLDALLARLGLVEEEEREVWILEHAEDEIDLRRANSRTPDVRTVHRMTDRGRYRHICDRMDDVIDEVREKRGKKGWG